MTKMRQTKNREKFNKAVEDVVVVNARNGENKNL